MTRRSRIVIPIACAMLAFACSGGDSHHEDEGGAPSATVSADQAPGTAIATDTTAAATDTATTPTTTGDFGDLTNLKNRTEARAQAAVDQAKESREEEAKADQ